MGFGFKPVRSDEEYKVVVLVRTDLDMGKGKMAAQVGHASVELALRAQKMDRKAFDAWNDEVDETDFSEPALLYFYAIYEGRVFGIEMWNPDFEKYLEDDPMLTCLCQCLGGLKLPETED